MWVSYMEKGRERKIEKAEEGEREGRGGERKRRAEIEVTLQGPKYMKKYGVDRVR